MKTNYMKPTSSCYAMELGQLLQASTGRMEIDPTPVDGSQALSRHRSKNVWDDEADEAEEEM
ncbi:MAG: hypothetical protein IJ200_03950 [Prevotella sp.]|nr:hypothetical protein [Prevotella sp.]MBQ9645474.1 hypothetical protein [Prevotella sp.]